MTMIRPTRPLPVVVGGLLVVLLFFGYTLHGPPRTTNSTISGQSSIGAELTHTDAKLHILLPASNGAVDLCKTFLTGAILGYPTPTLIAWQKEFKDNRLLGGGSHVAKIYDVLDYLEKMDPSTGEDIVMMMDAYDIWFQLRPEVLISRYHSINQKANERLRKRLGNAYHKENIRQKIIFGAGKRCAPNQMHTIACYPIPDSPLPADLYGKNTDTVMGKNKATSHRQRYLNSGYIIGQQKDMLALFRRAAEKVKAQPEHDPWDNGSGGSDLMYHGSDQSIFNIMYGEQEYQREVLRRRHLSSFSRLRGHGQPIPHYLESAYIPDPLNPPFTHQPGVAKEGRPDEFGIGMDYFSDLGHQTVNTADDTLYLTFNSTLQSQISVRNGLFDCASHVSGSLPQDILSSTTPLHDLNSPTTWNEVALFTNVCLDTIPVMIHHNGDKGARGWHWPMTWMQPHARALMTQVWERDPMLEGREGKATGGAWFPGGEYVGWAELCPREYEWELFRDVEKPAVAPPPM